MKAKVYFKAFSLIFAVIFSVLLIMIFIYGLELYFAGKSDRIPFKESGSFSIFVGGAVENEKFYDVRYSETYGELFLAAGALEGSTLKVLDYHETINPYDGNIVSKAVNRSEWFIICNYENFTNKNINYASIADLIECGIPEGKAANIKEYITSHGNIANKNELVEKGLLTLEEFEAVKYKIFAYIAY